MEVLQMTIISVLLCGLIQHTTGFCNVTCTNDYLQSLNCTCAGQQPAPSYQLLGNCSYEDGSAESSCEITTDQRWCELSFKGHCTDLSEFQGCHVCVKNSNVEGSIDPEDCTDVYLTSSIKPKAPENLTLLENQSNYNLSWKMWYTEDREGYYLVNNLRYEVRIKDTSSEKLTDFLVNEDRRYLVIPHSRLGKGREYTAEVRVSLIPDFDYSGPWSEWSPAYKWRTQSDGWQSYSLYGVLPFVAFVVILCYIGKRRLQKKPYLHNYIPSPEDFFKPLYLLYDGDFKKWVGPTCTFSACDFLEKNTVVPVVDSKHRTLEKLCEIEGMTNSKDSQGRGDASFLSLSTEGGFKLYFPGGSGQTRDKSTGHISIDTVTVWGEEGLDCPDYSSSGGEDPYRSCRGGHECFGYPPSSLETDGLLSSGGRRSEVVSCGCVSLGYRRGQQAGQDGGEGSGDSPGPVGLYSLHGPNGWQLESGDNESERISLDSFVSNDRSEDDGYPRVGLDLDTIDSGFAESDCSSPVHSDFNSKEPMNPAVLNDQELAQTNYVKQWVAYTSKSSVEESSSS
ncbi:interleukin 21 receptor, tandem duplicate 1 [Amia ocellicauda]|uniref:interleukin 21 receptor, tandem duplicate 1 n=1 Tax=Amia ocellicauda TaxID=2972642 RepID=UPI003463EF8B|nr:IL21R protein [Amia calva]